MDVHLQRLAAAQVDVVAAWQLTRLGWTRKAIRHRVKRDGWRIVHPGVYALSQAPLTQLQRWMAAALTAPATYLSHLSASTCWGFHIASSTFETVTRVGSGGPQRVDGVLVRRSVTLDGQSAVCNGIPITSPVRTLIDISAGLSARAVGRAFREALRLQVLTTRDLVGGLIQHRGRRGTRVLWDLAERYSSVPYRRTRSNAEARGLEILYDAEVDPPAVNVRIAGEEADLAWPRRRLIVEIDGPQYHRFREEDVRKQTLWESAGYTVKRISSAEVYANPNALIALVAG
jgi:very-short-patch-repair endonuclease